MGTITGIWSSLKREQKESVALLSTGTFLEYFDLMLYVHMGVLLNELFFPKYDPYTTSIVAAATLCSTYIMRPVGALIFGWIGDHIGRKTTIIITTAMMAISCIVMANLPTYAQIGISAAWIMIICRMLQGMSSMGEIIGAEIYLTESISRPAAFPIVASLSIVVQLGAVAALGVATLVTSSGFNWRYAFWAGAVIALVSAFARKRLRETSEFLKMKKQSLKKGVEELNLECDPDGAEFNATWKEPVEPKTLLSYLMISCGGPICFYLMFIYFNPILKESFGYSSEDIIRHNFLLSLVALVCTIFITYLSYRIHPVKIQKIRGTLAFFLMISLPFLILNVSSSIQVFLIQALITLLALEITPADAVCLVHFPFYRRVTYAGFLFALSRALMFVVTSFGLVYLGSYFGHFGIWFIVLPITIGYLYGVRHFEGLERKLGVYPNLVRKASRNKKKLLHAD